MSACPSSNPNAHEHGASHHPRLVMQSNSLYFSHSNTTTTYTTTQGRACAFAAVSRQGQATRAAMRRVIVWYVHGRRGGPSPASLPHPMLNPSPLRSTSHSSRLLHEAASAASHRQAPIAHAARQRLRVRPLSTSPPVTAAPPSAPSPGAVPGIRGAAAGPPTQPYKPGFFSRNVGKIVLVTLGSLIAYLYRSSEVRICGCVHLQLSLPPSLPNCMLVVHTVNIIFSLLSYEFMCEGAAVVASSVYLITLTSKRKATKCRTATKSSHAFLLPSLPSFFP
jgi:hypothetical protein